MFYAHFFYEFAQSIFSDNPVQARFVELAFCANILLKFVQIHKNFQEKYPNRSTLAFKVL